MLFTTDIHSYPKLKKEILNLGIRRADFYDDKFQFKINKRIIKKLTTELLYSYCSLKTYGCDNSFIYIAEMSHEPIRECTGCRLKTEKCIDQIMYKNNLLPEIQNTIEFEIEDDDPDMFISFN
jgi:hypothetical protein